MKLIITYSLKEEFKETLSILLHVQDYKNLRSVIWPSPSVLFSMAATQREPIKKILEIWSKKSVQIGKAFAQVSLKDPEDVICFVHSISCEGWFNVDDNSIHIRVGKNDTEKEILDTIVHELIHLSTYDEKLSYDERERLVDQYILKPVFQKLLTNK